MRPDGRISLPLLRDVEAAGLTPDQLRQHLEAIATPFFANVNATVIVHEINSRKVFVTGEVAHPRGFTLNGPMTVLQALALAGGLSEFSEPAHIDVLRNERGVLSDWRSTTRTFSRAGNRTSRSSLATRSSFDERAAMRIPSLDGLRAVSIVLVLLAHVAGTAQAPAFLWLRRSGTSAVSASRCSS